LRPVAIDFDASLDLHEIIARDAFDGSFELIPHACFDGAAAVAELKAQIGFAFASVADLLFTNKKKCGDGLLGIEISNERSLHVAIF